MSPRLPEPTYPVTVACVPGGIAVELHAEAARQIAEQLDGGFDPALAYALTGTRVRLTTPDDMQALVDSAAQAHEDHLYDPHGAWDAADEQRARAKGA